MSAVLEDKQTALEAVGPAFTKEQMLSMRGKVRGIIHEVAALVKPGMVEEDAVAMAKDILAAARHGPAAGTTSMCASAAIR